MAAENVVVYIYPTAFAHPMNYATMTKMDAIKLETLPLPSRLAALRNELDEDAMSIATTANALFAALVEEGVPQEQCYVSVQDTMERYLHATETTNDKERFTAGLAILLATLKSKMVSGEI